MDFNTLIDNRKTNFTWTEEKVDNDKIVEIVNNVLTKVPSKQKRMPYKIDVFDNSNQQLRNRIFEYTHRDEEASVDEDYGNPQTLAPHLLLFSRRGVDTSKMSNANDVWGFSDQRIIFMEIGVVSMMLMMAFENEGLSTGFCQCIQMKQELADELGIENPVELMMGVGYKSNAEMFFDPRTNTTKDVYLEHHHKRPSLENIVTYRW